MPLLSTPASSSKARQLPPFRDCTQPSEILQWQEAFLAGGERSLKSNPNDELHEKDQKIDQLHRKIGQMTMDVEILTKAQEIMARELGGNPAGFGTGSGSKS